MITPQLIRAINIDIQEALQSVAKKHGVKISLGGTSYSKADFTTKVKVESAEAEQVKGEESKQWAKLLDLPEDVIGLKFQIQGKDFEVIRLDISKPKNPVIAKGTDGKTYKMPVATLKHNAKI